jgi:hypothetical protein
VRVAIGWRQGDVFMPIAHSAAIETPSDAPSPMMVEAFFAWSPAGVVRIDPASERAFAGGGVRDATGRRRAGAGASASPGGRRDGLAGGGQIDDAAEPFGSSEHAYA